ncbi:ribonuclease HI [Synoicihabitans lomoniglobus]|uniref:RNase H type-1 domain-containing protein n=1 Tax=Synoicihabitans lomoniglobus TaxID=2909285 RepID=A0AAF0CGV6_9BACT|nr:hypothetical protein [Opitutaceae bacterium LMO-M01]WED63767.1 hypothetical protein PXH66_15630 [Opitutaceae bacterium LMO-M01]
MSAVPSPSDSCPHCALLTDGSVHPATGLGFGGYLCGRSADLSIASDSTAVCLRRFKATTAARLELQTLIWALREIPICAGELVVYTDSQTIVGLPSRRGRLERAEYRSRRGTLLKQHDLYREFYDLCDTRPFTIKKIPGHQPTTAKTGLASAFSLVDRATRRALRQAIPTDTDTKNNGA